MSTQPSSHVDSDPSPRCAEKRRVQWSGEGLASVGPDWVAVEEPLLLQIAGVRLGMLMRTPGDDHDLGVGFALTEGLVRSFSELRRVHHEDEDENVLVLVPAKEATLDLTLARRGLLSSSSCGICGRLSIEQIHSRCRTKPSRKVLRAATIRELPEALGASQPAFRLSGGHHAAALATCGGRVVLAREDIGRHNAVDKVIGAAARAGWDPADHVLVTSGRCSLEIVQKAAMVGIGTIVAIGAVSSLSIELAQDVGVTLVGFTSSQRLSVYVGEEFVDGAR